MTKDTLRIEVIELQNEAVWNNLPAETRNQIIADYLNQKPTVETMTLAEARAGVKMAKLKQCEAEVTNAVIDWDESVKKCLSLRKPHTASTERVGIDNFNKWCHANNIDQVRITRPQVIDRDYLVEAGLANHSINNYLGHVSVVWNYIIDKHELSRRNPMNIRGLKVESKEKRVKHTPTPKEELKILEYLKDKDTLVYETLRLHIKYGTRIGSFVNMRREGNKLYYISKGKPCLTPIIIKWNELDKYDALIEQWSVFRSLNPVSFSHRINRWLKRCYERGIVEHYYPTHSFRRSFTETMLLKGKPTVEVSKLLNHRSLRSIKPYTDTIDKRMSTFTGLDFIK